MIEALRQSPAVVEDERPDESARPVAVRLQRLGPRRQGVLGVEGGVVADAVRTGERAGGRPTAEGRAPQQNDL
jgi:hypothetical protein